jgi:hypothetical protein
MGRVVGLLSASAGETLRLLLSAALLSTVSLGIDRFSLSRVRAILLWTAGFARPLSPGTPTPGRTAWAVKIADRQLPGDRTCLVRSLAGETLLRLYGFAPEHRIGVDKGADGAVEAHSWLEHEGRILIGNLDDLSRYEPLPSLDHGDAP